VSSILNALKKLERERPPAGGKSAWPHRIDTRRPLRRWDIHSGRFIATLWAVLAAAVFVAGGWGLLYWRSAESHFMPEEPGTANRIEDPAPAARPPAHPPPADPGKVLTAGNPVPRMPMRQPAPAEPAPKKKAPIQSSQTAASPQSEPQILTEGFQLQAISWSERTEERMAVVNGKIVREGAVMDGYKIARIEPEEVILSKADRRWRLVFVSR